MNCEGLKSFLRYIPPPKLAKTCENLRKIAKFAGGLVKTCGNLLRYAKIVDFWR